MIALRRPLLGLVLLAVAAVAFAGAAAVAPAIVPGIGTASGDPDLVVSSPVSLLATPALLAAGSVLLVGGVAALADTDLSARAALLAPGVGALVGFAVVTGVATAPAAVLAALSEPDALTTAVAGRPGGAAAGAIVGGAVASVVRATLTEDTPVLFASSALLLATIAAGSSDVVSLFTGGVGGTAAVALLWTVDPDRWRP